MADPADRFPELTPESAECLDAAAHNGSPHLTPGDLFAGYQIAEEIGRGTFGVVYRAFDRSPLQRMVALKTIRLPALSDAEEAVLTRRRFLDEARLAGSLSHTNIATVFDVTEHAGVVYYARARARPRSRPADAR